MIKLTFEKLSRFDRRGEPCSIAVPFALGALKDPSRVTILDSGKPIPTQWQVTAKWPDDSVKWLYLDFQADLPGNAQKSLELVPDGVGSPKPGTTVTVSHLKNDGLLINTGELEMELNGPGELNIFGRIEHAGAIYGKGSFEGPFIGSFKGIEWTAEIDRIGWKIIKPGPLVAVVQAKGKHRNSMGEYLLDFEIEITAFAGKPWVQIDYRIINREPNAGLLLEEIGFTFNDKANEKRQIKTALATSNYLSAIQTGTGDQRLTSLIDADYLIYDANEHFPETFYGTYWAAWQTETNGICITHYQAYQNFPKSLKVDKEGIYAGILPKGSDIQLLQGVAKTHRLLFHFYHAEAGWETVNCRSLQFQLPDRPALSPDVYREAGVFENIFVAAKVDWVEQSFINMADSRVRAYGMLNWGDAPDAGYTAQGRGNGDLVWTNNEYDFPHAAMLLYAKTAERRFLDYMLVSARHQMDVDICHYSEDPLRYQGQITHSGRHVTGEVAPCHQWVQGLLDYYHVTGDKRALETALGIGENVKRLLEQPRYHGAGGINARETGWALRTLVALYQETNDSSWLDQCERIVDHYEIWQKQYGGWLAPYTDHTVIRVPFMIAVAVNSLIRYYWVKPQLRIKTMIVAAVEDLVANCLLENGLFYYKELPSLRRNGGNPLLLEALAHAYELTGELSFLKAGLPTFKLCAAVSRSFAGSKQKKEDAVIQWGGAGPKMFAQAFPAMAYYYRVAVEAGIDLG